VSGGNRETLRLLFFIDFKTLRPGVVALSTTHSPSTPSHQSLDIYDSQLAVEQCHIPRRSQCRNQDREHTSARAGREDKEEPQLHLATASPDTKKEWIHSLTGTPFLVFVTAGGQG
jgi:hypothetical protein